MELPIQLVSDAAWRHHAGSKITSTLRTSTLEHLIAVVAVAAKPPTTG